MSSVLVTIEVDVKKFLIATGTDAEKFAVAFDKLFKKSPNALQAIENFVNEAAPVITVAVGLADPAIEPVVAQALGLAESGLAALYASATAATSGASLVANLQNFANTVPALLTAVDVKNPLLRAAITRIVTLVVGEAKVLIPAAQAWVAQLAAKSAPATA